MVNCNFFSIVLTGTSFSYQELYIIWLASYLEQQRKSCVDASKVVPQRRWETDEDESLCEMMPELHFMGSTYSGCYKAKSRLKNNPINAFLFPISVLVIITP